MVRKAIVAALSLTASPALADSNTTCTSQFGFVNCNTRQSPAVNASPLVEAILARRRNRSAETPTPPRRPPADLSNGNGFMAACSEDGPAASMWNSGLCYGFLDGFIQREFLFGRNAQICFPQNVNNKQIMDVVLASIRANPEARHLPTGLLAYGALTHSFPCRQPVPPPPQK